MVLQGLKPVQEPAKADENEYKQHVANIFFSCLLELETNVKITAVAKMLVIKILITLFNATDVTK